MNNIEDSFQNKVPSNFQPINNKDPLIKIEDLIKNDDNEIILFEIPKGFDKTLLNNIKIKSLKGNGKLMRVLKNYNGIYFDHTHPIPRQTLGLYMKKNKKSFLMKSMDGYVKIHEKFDIPSPKTENIIPRRLLIKKSMRKKKANTQS